MTVYFSSVYLLLLSHGECIKKIYDTDLGYEGIKMSKIKKNAKIFFVLFFFSQRKFAKNGLVSTFFLQIMKMNIYQIYENVYTSIKLMRKCQTLIHAQIGLLNVIIAKIFIGSI